MDDLEKIQNEIQKLAYECFRNVDCSEGFTYPLIPRISEMYLKNRVVVMAQETNTWVGHIDCPEKQEKFLGGCLAEYDRFVRDDVARHRGKLWQFSRSLYKRGLLDGCIQNGSMLSHCWMNLFCIEKSVYRNDKNKGHLPSQNRELANRVLEIQQDFIFQVLRLIQPKVILALIGNKNDDLLKKYALGTTNVKSISIDSSNAFGEHELAELKVCENTNPLHETLILRTYHPTYFMGRMKGRERRALYRDLIYDRIQSFLGK
ncbi:MAG: hypothetical protein IKB43_10595 [Fibrobacter sp.]|nr:hypothetical protein [Fibrobacter sp.]